MFIWYMVVSWNRDTPASSIFKGIFLINKPFLDTPIYGNPHMRSIWNNYVSSIILYPIKSQLSNVQNPSIIPLYWLVYTDSPIGFHSHNPQYMKGSKIPQLIMNQQEFGSHCSAISPFSSLISPWKMVMFHSYVNVYQKVSIHIHPIINHL